MHTYIHTYIHTQVDIQQREVKKVMDVQSTHIHYTSHKLTQTLHMETRYIHTYIHTQVDIRQREVKKVMDVRNSEMAVKNIMDWCIEKVCMPELFVYGVYLCMYVCMYV
jgi:hypothetical protein